MKFEELLMQQKRAALEQEVSKLTGELEAEETLASVLESALNGSIPSNQRISPLLPRPVQVLLSELALVEEEIKQLEGKVEELSLDLYQERELTEARQRIASRKSGHHRSKAHSNVSDIPSLASKTAFNRETGGMSRKVRIPSRENGIGRVELQANELSEELVKCLIGIFLELNQTSSSLDREGSAIVPKISLSCMNSKGFIAKTQSITCKSQTYLFDFNCPSVDPYGILPDFDASTRDIGPYKDFIQLTGSSLDVSRFPECSTGIRKLRVLMHKLSSMELDFLSYKQKLAFWINVYNACIMHAFLEHGLPSTQEKLLSLMNKAAFNVGGIVLNALAIEHFILRYPSESKPAPAYEKEMLLRNAYGLGYPEPNVTFALCRGTRSSPALRVYTADDVVNEMERAKVEYLEASVGVTSRKKIVVPKLLQWHISDFADDMESLLEWIYSQLRRSGSLKRPMMECLKAESKMVEVSPYESHFRYLLPQSLAHSFN